MSQPKSQITHYIPEWMLWKFRVPSLYELDIFTGKTELRAPKKAGNRHGEFTTAFLRSTAGSVEYIIVSGDAEYRSQRCSQYLNLTQSPRAEFHVHQSTHINVANIDVASAHFTARR